MPRISLSFYACRIVVALWCTVAPSLVRAGDQEFRPPFGLAWDATAIDLEMGLVSANGQIVTRKKEAGDGETWLVEGLPQIALQRAKFHLLKDKLAGVELEYGKADWTPANYDGFMKSVRQRLEEKHGPGTQIARKQDSDRGVLQTLVGYRWDVTGGSIELVYFAAQSPVNVFRTVSLHYAAAPPAEPAESDAAH